MRRGIRVWGAISGAIAFAAAMFAVDASSEHVSAEDARTAVGSLHDGYAVAQAPFIASNFCLDDLSVQSLSNMFQDEPGGIIGADYPRTVELPTGSVLWTFQDARVRTPDGGARYVHNIGMVQTGRCFSILVGGSAAHPEAWLFEEHTSPTQRWFWPLDGAIGDDGKVYIFAAEMHERGESYLTESDPGGTFVARFDPVTWNIDFYGQPGDISSDLYGWSIASDSNWTYLFAHCHRQFGFDPYLGVAAHDRSCTNQVTVARVPAGRLFDQPTYWTGTTWSSDRSRAVPVIEDRGQLSSPTQVMYRNHRWVATTKVDDWWGDEVIIEAAVHPTGPFVELERRRVSAKCARECNTYFASWVDGQNNAGPTDAMIMSLSHNRWDGEATHIYRPSFEVVLPPETSAAAPAMRCSLGHCE